MRIIIAGGGTGGHVIPALAIAQQLKRRFGAEILFIGTARGIETRLVPQAGFPLELIKVGALNRVSLMTPAENAIRSAARHRQHCRSNGLSRVSDRRGMWIGRRRLRSGPAMVARFAASSYAGL